MLDQKIKEQIKQKDYLITKINEKEKNLKNMFAELIKEANQNDTLYQSLRGKEDKLKVQKNAIKKTELEIFFWSKRLVSIDNVQPSGNPSLILTFLEPDADA